MMRCASITRRQMMLSSKKARPYLYAASCWLLVALLERDILVALRTRQSAIGRASLSFEARNAITFAGDAAQFTRDSRSGTEIEMLIGSRRDAGRPLPSITSPPLSPT